MGRHRRHAPGFSCPLAWPHLQPRSLAHAVQPQVWGRWGRGRCRTKRVSCLSSCSAGVCTLGPARTMPALTPPVRTGDHVWVCTPRAGSGWHPPARVREAHGAEACGRRRSRAVRGQGLRGRVARPGVWDCGTRRLVVDGFFPSHTFQPEGRQLGGRLSGWCPSPLGALLFCPPAARGHRPRRLGLAGAHGPELWSPLFQEW